MVLFYAFRPEKDLRFFFLSFPGGNATPVFQPGSATEGLKYIRNFVFYRGVIPSFYFLVFFIEIYF